MEAGTKTIQITMPPMGESVTEGTILEWLKQVGDEVEADEGIVEVSTDKVDAEVPAPASGVLTKILVEPDETVPVGTVLGEISPNGGQPADESVVEEAEHGADLAQRVAVEDHRDLAPERLPHPVPAHVVVVLRHALAGLGIARLPVRARVVERVADRLDRLVARLVLLLVADVEKPARIPHGTFSKPESAGNRL